MRNSYSSLRRTLISVRGGHGILRACESAGFPILTEEGVGPCSTSRIKAESLIQPDGRSGSGGIDSAMEWSFFVTEDALKQLQPSAERNEESLLLAFDTHRAAIHAAAMRAYARNRRGSYELAVADF
jgi:Protein of unknown function (DUF1488)